MQNGFLSGMQNGCRLAFVPGCFGTKAPSAIADMLEHIHVCTKIYNVELTVCHSMCRAQTQVVGAYQLSVLVLPMLTVPMMVWEPKSEPAPNMQAPASTGMATAITRQAPVSWEQAFVLPDQDGLWNWGSASQHCSACTLKRHGFRCQLHKHNQLHKGAGQSNGWQPTSSKTQAQ